MLDVALERSAPGDGLVGERPALVDVKRVLVAADPRQVQVEVAVVVEVGEHRAVWSRCWTRYRRRTPRPRRCRRPCCGTDDRGRRSERRRCREGRRRRSRRLRSRRPCARRCKSRPLPGPNWSMRQSGLDCSTPCSSAMPASAATSVNITVGTWSTGSPVDVLSSSSSSLSSSSSSGPRAVVPTVVPELDGSSPVVESSSSARSRAGVEQHDVVGGVLVVALTAVGVVEHGAGEGHRRRVVAARREERERAHEGVQASGARSPASRIRRSTRSADPASSAVGGGVTRVTHAARWPAAASCALSRPTS